MDPTRQTSPNKVKQFKLLPPLPPEAKGIAGPSRRLHKPSVSEPSSSFSIPLEDFKDVRENPIPVQPPPQAHVKSKSDSLPKPDSLSGSKALHSASKRDSKKPGHWASLRSNVSSSTTLVNGGGAGNHQLTPMPSSLLGVPAIPMVPPGHIPDMSAWQQQDFLPRSRSQSRSHRKSRGIPKDTLSPEPEIDRVLGPKSVPASVMDFTIGGLDSSEVQYSSAAELRGLWEAANGQRPENMPDRSFTLRFAR